MIKTLKTQKGFTLVELMVAMTLGIIAVSVIIFMFVEMKKSYRENENIAVMQENARYSLDLLAYDLRHAGFYGGILDNDTIRIDTSVNVGTDCDVDVSDEDDWLTNITDDIDYSKDTNLFSCISSGVNSDGYVIKGSTLSIRAVSSRKVTALETNHLYLRSNMVSACIWKAKNDSLSTPENNTLCPTGGIITDWELISNVYYISKSDPRNPVLSRKKIDQGTGATMTTESLVDGIERIYLEFGLDDDVDGIIETYSASPTADEMKNAVAVKIYLLAKSPNIEQGYVNTKIYTLGGTTLAAFNDAYKRRVYSTTVLLRNMANLRKL